MGSSNFEKKSTLSNHLIPGIFPCPGNKPVTKGRYAGPVVDGKTDIALVKLPPLVNQAFCIWHQTIRYIFLHGIFTGTV